MNTVKQFIFTVMALCLAVGSAAAPVSVAYTYDTLNRLTAAAYTDGSGIAYAYDGAGNLLSLVVTPPPNADTTTTTTTTTTTSSTEGTTSTTVASSTTTTQASTTTLSYPLTLAQGWNLLGNSLNQTLPVATVYGDPDVVTTVWKWDVSNAGWQFFAPSMDAATLLTYVTNRGYGLLDVVNPGEGYWVNAKTPATLITQTGTAYSLAAADLKKGWNLVATSNNVSPSAFNLSLSVTPPQTGTIPINLSTLWAWNNALSQWYFYAPSLEASGDLGAYTTSKGYLDFVATGITLGNGVGFWVKMP
jgi:YD repeat-containing protein